MYTYNKKCCGSLTLNFFYVIFLEIMITKVKTIQNTS